MKNGRPFRLSIILFALLTSPSFPGIAQTGRNIIASRTATVEGVKLRYLTARHGPTLILLHGYTQTWINFKKREKVIMNFTSLHKTLVNNKRRL